MKHVHMSNAQLRPAEHQLLAEILQDFAPYIATEMVNHSATPCHVQKCTEEILDLSRQHLAYAESHRPEPAFHLSLR